jgi:hypothetical protein
MEDPNFQPSRQVEIFTYTLLQDPEAVFILTFSYLFSPIWIEFLGRV